MPAVAGVQVSSLNTLQFRCGKRLRRRIPAVPRPQRQELDNGLTGVVTQDKDPYAVRPKDERFLPVGARSRMLLRLQLCSRHLRGEPSWHLRGSVGKNTRIAKPQSIA